MSTGKNCVLTNAGIPAVVRSIVVKNDIAAKDNSIATLQNKLETTRANIRTLSNENEHLRKTLYTPAKTVSIIVFYAVGLTAYT